MKEAEERQASLELAQTIEIVFSKEEIRNAVVQTRPEFADESSMCCLLLDPLVDQLLKPVNQAYDDKFNELYAKHVQREKLATADDQDVELQLETQFQKFQLTQKSLENHIVKHFSPSDDKKENGEKVHKFNTQVSDLLC